MSTLSQVAKHLRAVLTSSRQAEPGQAVTLSLVPSPPLARSAVNLALSSKDVVFSKTGAAPLPDNFSAGDVLASNSLNLAGGQPYPAAAPVVGQAVSDSEASGLLGQLFGNVDLPRVDVAVTWTVRDKDGCALTEGIDFIAPHGLSSPQVSLVFVPPFKEMRLDTVSVPGGDIRCIYPTVTLRLGDEIVGAQQLPGIPVVVLPVLVPTVVAMARHRNFEARNDGATLLLVPEHSALSSAEELNDELKSLREALSALTKVPKVAMFLLGLRALSKALDAPYIGFFAADGLNRFGAITIGSRHFGLTSVDFDNKTSSVLVLGLPGTRVQFFNDKHFQKDHPSLPPIHQGNFDLKVADQFFVMVRDLRTRSKPVSLPEEGKPRPFPREGLVLNADGSEVDTMLNFVEDEDDEDFDNSISSVRFEKDWLAKMRGNGEGGIGETLGKSDPFPSLDDFACPEPPRDPGVVREACLRDPKLRR